MRIIYVLFSLMICTALHARLITVSSESAFRTALASGPVVVDFFATWCGPCKKMHSIVEQLAREFPSVTFVKVDIEELQNIASRYSVQSIPTLLFMKDGKVMDRTTGAKPKNTVAELIQKILGGRSESDVSQDAAQQAESSASESCPAQSQ